MKAHPQSNQTQKLKGNRRNKLNSHLSAWRPLDLFRITPEIFESVGLAHLLMQNVHHHVEVIEHHPTSNGLPLHVRGTIASATLYSLIYFP